MRIWVKDSPIGPAPHHHAISHKSPRSFGPIVTPIAVYVFRAMVTCVLPVPLIPIHTVGRSCAFASAVRLVLAGARLSTHGFEFVVHCDDLFLDALPLLIPHAFRFAVRWFASCRNTMRSIASCGAVAIFRRSFGACLTSRVARLFLAIAVLGGGGALCPVSLDAFSSVVVFICVFGHLGARCDVSRRRCCARVLPHTLMHTIGLVSIVLTCAAGCLAAFFVHGNLLG